jgi:hypothetical protein
MNASVTLRFRYTEEDYVRAMRFHLSKRMRPRLDVVAAIVLGLLSAYMLFAGAGPDWLWAFGCAASLLLFAILWFAWFVLPARAFRLEPKLHGEYLIEFGPDRIEFRTDGIDSRIEWKLYRELRSDDHTHLLVHGSNGFTALPRRVFAGPPEEAAFLQLVRQHVGAPGTVASRSPPG